MSSDDAFDTDANEEPLGDDLDADDELGVVVKDDEIVNGDEIEFDFDGIDIDTDEIDVAPVGGEDDETDFSKVDTRGLNGAEQPKPNDVEPEVEPAGVQVTAPVDETITATFTTSAERELNTSDIEEVQEITDEKPDKLPDPERVAALRARVIRIDINDPEYEAAYGTVIVADRTGATEVTLSTHQDIIKAFQNDVKPGDDVLLTSLVGTGNDRYKYAASAVTTVHVVESDEYPAGYYLNKQSELNRLREIFADAGTQAIAHNQVADVIVDEYEIAIPYTNADDPVWWMYYDDGDEKGLWLPHGRQRLETMLGEKLPYDVNSARHRREILRNVKVRCRVEPDEFAQGAPADKDLQWMVGVQNGVIDLRTGDMYDHNPKWRLSSKLPVEYKPDEYDGSLGDGLDWFLDDVCESDEDRRMCLAMAAHSLMRHHNIKSAFPILGPSNSGKTKWHGVIKRLLGYDNVHTMNFESFAAGDGFETGKILGVHAALDDDASGKKINDLNFFKKVTGGEEVSVNRKYEKLADYTPYSTISWVSNDPAVLGERNSGVTSRLYPVVMPYRHTEDDDEHKDKIDATTLESRIYAKEELEALLVAAVQKAREMYDSGDVGATRTEKERWQLYDWWSDGVKRFFRECIVESPSTVTPKSAVYEAYSRWCVEEGLEPMSPSQFWRTARRSVTYFDADGVWFDSSTRGVKHIELGPDGLDYAPDAIVEKLDTGASNASLNIVTGIRDIHPFRGPSFYTVEGTVKLGDPYVPGFLIEDDTGAVRVYVTNGRDTEIKEACDGSYVPKVAEGDTVRLSKMEKDREDGKLCLQYVHGYSEITVLETTPDDDDQDVIPRRTGGFDPDIVSNDDAECVNNLDDSEEESSDETTASDQSGDVTAASDPAGQDGVNTDSETTAADGCAADSLPGNVAAHIRNHPNANATAIVARPDNNLSLEDRPVVEAALENRDKRGDNTDTAEDGGDPPKPDRFMHENEVQCRECGHTHPVAWLSDETPMPDDFNPDGTCPTCSAAVDYEWNAEHRSFNMKYVPDAGDGEECKEAVEVSRGDEVAVEDLSLTQDEERELHVAVKSEVAKDGSGTLGFNTTVERVITRVEWADRETVGRMIRQMVELDRSGVDFIPAERVLSL